MLSKKAKREIILIVMLEVVSRYLFNRPIRGSYDMVETMLLVFVFNGMAAAFFGGIVSAIVIAVLYNWFAGKTEAE